MDVPAAVDLSGGARYSRVRFESQDYYIVGPNPTTAVRHLLEARRRSRAHFKATGE
jgi:hypothetical protein